MTRRAFLTVFLIFGLVKALAVEPEDDFTTKVVHDQNVVFSEKVPGFWRAELKGLSLPAGEKCLVEVPLTNPSSNRVLVQRGQTSCGCSRAELTPSEWEPEGKTLLSFFIETPKTAKSATLTTGVTFKAKSGNDPVTIIFALTCKFTGMLNFQKASNSLLVNPKKGVQEFALPLISSVDSPEFEVDFDGNFVFENVAIENGSGESTMKLAINPKLLKKIGGFGKLTVKDEKSGLTDFTHIVVQLDQHIRVSPQTLRISKVKSGYSTRAIVQFSEAKKNVSFEGVFAGRKVELNVRRLSDQVFRLDAKMPKAIVDRCLEADKFPPMQIRVKNGETLSVLESPVVFYQFGSFSSQESE